MSTTAKVTARERIDALLDDNSFVEIGGLVKARSTDFNIQAKDTPSDGVITGYGVINGKLVYIYSQDSSVFGGSVGEMHARKIANLYDMAMKMGAPVIGLIDSTGLRLQESAKEISSKVDAMIVIGGRHSSNTQKLYDICKKECSNTFFIQTAEDLSEGSDFKKYIRSCEGNSLKSIGITAGASTPKNIIEEVVLNVRDEF